ncbi:hypothetical protein OEZ85_011528 [Tetradesmus obliquus]|uniref:Uncharacterized protein n=1 Tax=Tetradesmus obliquus TaxID=3088 RepID=A0ABY8TQL6_TETOB|nr:hypothetical protein OEZ85_011528 [Tetradesmus obliquus]
MLTPTNSRVVSSSRTSARSAGNLAVRPARVVQTRASSRDQNDALASTAFAATAAAILLVSSPVSAAELSPNPLAVTAEGNIFSKLWNKVPKASPVTEDPYGADAKAGKTLASTKKAMPIITEQEAVAPEAFPNPAASRIPGAKPAVLAAAEGDEQRGPNRGQFEGLNEGDRQRLIDEKSPAQASRK